MHEFISDNAFRAPQIDILALQKQLKDSGLPIENVRIAHDLTVAYDWRRIPTEEEFQLAATIVASHDPEVHGERDVDSYALIADLAKGAGKGSL